MDSAALTRGTRAAKRKVVDVVYAFAFMVAWFVLQRWLLPKMGVST